MARRTRIAAGAAALGVVALAWFLLTLPPAPLTLLPPAWTPGRPVVRGAFHVHTTRSDGTGTPDQVARAAAAAGLAFVVFTDHGDGTRLPDQPAYRHGVLCLDGVEISTEEGHYIAVGLPQSPYPLGGEARDVVADVARLGGFGVVAHPGSPNASQRWNAWETPFDALEWLNADTEWRDESWLLIARLAMASLLRGPAALAAVLDRPDTILSRWDQLTRQRRVVGLAGADAHARLASFGGKDPYGGPLLPGFPSYETSFRVFSLNVELARPPNGQAEADADLLLEALRTGRVYTVIDALAGPALLDFEAVRNGVHWRAGDRLPPQSGPVVFHVRVNGTVGTRIVLYENGRVATAAQSDRLVFETVPQEGAYRVEVTLPQTRGRPPVPWIVSNPIYVRAAEHPVAQSEVTTPMSQEVISLLAPGDLSHWHLERDPSSVGEFDSVTLAEEHLARLAFRLAEGKRASQYVACVRPIAASAQQFTRVRLKLRANRLMRVSVQLRVPGPDGGHRWQRSILVDTVPSEQVVWFDDLRPADWGTALHPDLARVDSLLLVVDTTHTKPGTHGVLWLADVRLER